MKKKYNYTKKTGRPPKTLQECLPENWEEIVLSMCAEGASDVEIRGELCIFRDVNGKYAGFNHPMWDRLIEREAEFSSILKKGEVLCKKWWMEVGRKNVKNNFFNTALWFINMKNRFGWRDKTEVEYGLSDSFSEKFKDLTTKQLVEKVDELLNRKK